MSSITSKITLKSQEVAMSLFPQVTSHLLQWALPGLCLSIHELTVGVVWWSIAHVGTCKLIQCTGSSVYQYVYISISSMYSYIRQCKVPYVLSVLVTLPPFAWKTDGFHSLTVLMCEGIVPAGRLGCRVGSFSCNILYKFLIFCGGRTSFNHGHVWNRPTKTFLSGFEVPNAVHLPYFHVIF